MNAPISALLPFSGFKVRNKVFKDMKGFRLDLFREKFNCFRELSAAKSKSV
jgi:hypothetical protein